MILDDEIRQVHEKYWDTEKQAAALIPSVILVEGDDDRNVVEGMLERKTRHWEQWIKIVVAGGRKQVIQRIGPNSTFPNAYGLVDRDTWSDDEVNAQRKKNPRLHVTAGWCIENLFFQPDFLQRFDARIADAVAAERESWLRAGAFWYALQRVREAHQLWYETLEWSKHYGTPHPDLDFSSPQKLVETLTQRVPVKLCNDVRLDFKDVANTFEQRLDFVLKLPLAQQWQVGIHGKCAFDQLLKPLLDRFLPPQDPKGRRMTWREKLAETPALGRPAPLDELLALVPP